MIPRYTMQTSRIVLFLSVRIRSSKNGRMGIVKAVLEVDFVLVEGLFPESPIEEDIMAVMCGNVVRIMVWMHALICGFVTACFPNT
jgi:hypothetical protein